MALANVVVTVTEPNVTVSSDNVNVSVAQTTTNVTVSSATVTSTGDIRSAISVSNVSGFGNLTYDSSAGSNGVIQYTGVSTSDIRGLFSNTSPIQYNSTTGVIGFDQQLNDLTLVKYQETVIDNGSVSGNISLDIATGTVHKITTSGDITGITLNNIDTGGSATILVTQGGGGGNQIDTTTHPSNWTSYEFVNQGKTIDENPGNFSVINIFYDGSKFFTSITQEQALQVQNSDLANSSITLNDQVINLGDTTTLAKLTDIGVNDTDVNAALLGFTTSADTGIIQSSGNIEIKNGGANNDHTTFRGSTSFIDTMQVYGVFETTQNINITGLSPGDKVIRLLDANIDMTHDGANIEGLTSNSVVEGTNLYFTTARANSAIGAYQGNISTAGTITAGASATDTHSFTGNLDVTGNIEVSGNLNYRNVEDLYVRDQSITLNANAASDATVSIIANRPVAGANTVLRWNETDDKWQFSNDGSTYEDISGLTNAQAQSFIQSSGLTMTADISTANNLDFTGTSSVLTMGETGKFRIGNISNSNNPILSFLPGNMHKYSLTDASADAFGVLYHEGVEHYKNDDDGIKLMYAKGRGTIASPAGPSDGDRVLDEYFMHYSDTKFKDRSNFGQAGRFVFYDAGVATYDDNTMPLTQEFFAFGGGDLTTGVPRSLLRLSANGTISFNGDATREDFTSANANIQLDGSINSSATITGTTLTDGTLNINAGNITSAVNVTGTGTVQGTTLTDGTLQITGGNISLIHDVDATGHFHAQEDIKSFGSDIVSAQGNVEALAGNIVGQYLHGDGSNVTLVGSSQSVKRTVIAAQTLAKGDVVYISGGTGDNPEVSKADASDPAKMPAFGITTEAVGGTLTTDLLIYGEHTSYDTSAFVTGDSLFVDATTPGALANTAPTGETNLIQKIGKVIKGGSSGGKITVTGAGRTNATPNLDDGKFFLGNAANQSATADFTDEANTAIGAYTGTMTNVGQITSSGTINISDPSSFFQGNASGLTASTIPTGQTNTDAQAYIVGAGLTNMTANITSYANIQTNTHLITNNLTGYSDAFTGYGTKGININLANVSGGLKVNQPLMANSNVEILKTSGDGYAPFISNTLNPAIYSGDGAMQNDGAGSPSANAQPLYAYVANATITEGNTTVVIDGITRLYQYYGGGEAPSTLFTDAANITTILSEVAVNSIPKTGGLRTFTQAPLAKGTYITGVDAANGTISLSEEPVASATLASTVTGADTTGQNSLWIGAGAYNTEIQYAEMYVSYADRVANIADSNYFPIYSITCTLDQYGAPPTGLATSDLTYTTNNPASWTAADYTTSGRTVFTVDDGAINSPYGLTVGPEAGMGFKTFNDNAGSTFGLNVGWDGKQSPTSAFGSTGVVIPQIGLASFTDNTVQDGSTNENGPRFIFQSRYGDSDSSELDQYPRSGQELGRIAYWGTHGDNPNPSTTSAPGYISFAAADDWTDGSNTNAYFVATSNYTDTTSRDPFLTYQAGELIIASGQPTSSQANIQFAPAVQVGNNPQNVYDFSSDAGASGSHGWATINYANVAAPSGAEISVNNGMSLGAGTVGDMKVSLHRKDNTYTANVAVTDIAQLWRATDAGTSQDVVQVTAGALPRGVDVLFSGVTDANWTFLNGNVYQLVDVGFGTVYSGLTQSNVNITQGTATIASPGGQYEYVSSAASGVTDRKYELSLAEQSENLKLTVAGDNGTKQDVLEIYHGSGNSFITNHQTVVTGTLSVALDTHSLGIGNLPVHPSDGNFKYYPTDVNVASGTATLDAKNLLDITGPVDDKGTIGTVFNIHVYNQTGNTQTIATANTTPTFSESLANNTSMFYRFTQIGTTVFAEKVV